MSTSAKPESQAQAEIYLKSLLNKTLRITTRDERMFLGEFKCTDNELNIILSHTYEYRTPPPPKATSPCPQKITLDLQSRYIGLVVVPGTEVVKIEVEEFASQMRNAGGISAWGRGWDSIEVEV